MAVEKVTSANKARVPGKAKQRTVLVALSGTYTSGGEVITAKQLGFGRIIESVASLAGGNGVEATPVCDCYVTGFPGKTGQIRLLNGKTSSELAAGVAVTGVKVEISLSGF